VEKKDKIAGFILGVIDKRMGDSLFPEGRGEQTLII